MKSTRLPRSKSNSANSFLHDLATETLLNSIDIPPVKKILVFRLVFSCCVTQTLSHLLKIWFVYFAILVQHSGPRCKTGR